MKCNSLIFQTIVENIALDKCSKIFTEALYIANDPGTLETFKDLFIEQSKLNYIVYYNRLRHLGHYQPL